MSKNVIKMIALAVAGAIIPIYAYICGASREEDVEVPVNTEPEEEVAVDTQ